MVVLKQALQQRRRRKYGSIPAQEQDDRNKATPFLTVLKPDYSEQKEPIMEGPLTLKAWQATFWYDTKRGKDRYLSMPDQLSMHFVEGGFSILFAGGLMNNLLSFRTSE
jgi:hypothetical protein